MAVIRLSLKLFVFLLVAACASASKPGVSSSAPSLSKFEKVEIGLPREQVAKLLKESVKKNETVAHFEKRFQVSDLKFVATIHRCGVPTDELGSDVYHSAQLGAQIAVSLKGDLQRVDLDEDLKAAPSEVNESSCRFNFN